MRRPKIAFFGLFGVGNLGNEASLQAVLQYVRQQMPAAELSCICANPEFVSEHHQIATFPIDVAPQAAANYSGNMLSKIVRKLILRIPLEIYLWFKAYNYLRHVDLMVIPGTGILDDFGVGPLQMPYDLFKWALVSRLTGTKLAFASIGAGPIVHPLSRFFMKSALGMSDFRSYRDQISKDFMQSIGFHSTHDPVYPDVVFGLEVDTHAPAYNTEKPPKVIGIGVMEYYGWSNSAQQGEDIYQRYIDKLTTFVAWLLEKEYEVRVLIGQSHDQRAVDDLSATLKQRQVVYRPEQLIAEQIESIEALFGQIAQTDVVVATRFHNVLCALMSNRPVVSIGYAKKNDVLMAEMGMGNFCQHIEDFDVDKLMDQFSELVDQRQQFARQMEQKNSAYQHALAQQYAQIFDLAGTAKQSFTPEPA